MVHGQKRVKFYREGNVILLEYALSQKLNCGTQVLIKKRLGKLYRQKSFTFHLEFLILNPDTF